MPTGEKAQNEPQNTPVNRDGHRRSVITTVVLGIALVVTLVIAGATSGFGPPSVPDGDIAIVEGVDPEGVSKADFDVAFEQQIGAQGLDKAPAEGTPQYGVVESAAIDDVLLSRWVLGEAQQRGITASDREIEQELEDIKATSFGSEEEFEDFLSQSNMTLDQATDRVRLQVLSTRIQDQVVTKSPEISDEDIRNYYEANGESLYVAPEARDVRIIVVDDEDDAQAAADSLSEDDGDDNWAQIAKEFSTDKSTSSVGGLNEAMTRDSLEPATAETVFSAEAGVVVGPTEASDGFLVFEVEKITPQTVTPFEEVEEQIRQTLTQQLQQEDAAAFQLQFINRWTARTICADGYETPTCSNAPPVDDGCPGDDPDEELPVDENGKDAELACPAPVPSVPVVSPGSAGLGIAAPRLYQGPQNPLDATLGGAEVLGSLAPPQ